MKKIIVLLICTLISFTIKAQSLIGAWENYTTSENGDQLKTVVIFTEGYKVVTTYNTTISIFLHSSGGSWKLDGNIMTEITEFDTDNSEIVGTEVNIKISITDDALEIPDSKLKFNRIDNGTPGKLQGAWLMSGRIKDEKTETRDTSRPRKTMKILSGSRFQWIAYNTETKQFMGTGGGTYTTVDGVYTENIEFFSKDDSRVGMSLEFNFELLDGEWIHTGFSSKGDPIHEIWSLRV